MELSGLTLGMISLVFRSAVSALVTSARRKQEEYFMKLTKIAVILAVIAGIILYFVLPANQLFLYFGIPEILIVNGVRIFEQRKKCSSN